MKHGLLAVLFIAIGVPAYATSPTPTLQFGPWGLTGYPPMLAPIGQEMGPTTFEVTGSGPNRLRWIVQTDGTSLLVETAESRTSECRSSKSMQYTHNAISTEVLVSTFVEQTFNVRSCMNSGPPAIFLDILFLQGSAEELESAMDVLQNRARVSYR